MKEVVLDGENVATDEKFVKSKSAKPSVVVESPFKAKVSELRERRGWHQTWKREDEVDQAKVWGYVNIRECARDKEGVLTKEVAGKETGPVMKRLELSTKDTWEYAMEVPEHLYEQDIQAMARIGEERINQSGVQFREVVENANSAYGRRGGFAEVVDTGYEQQAEDPVVMTKK